MMIADRQLHFSISHPMDRFRCAKAQIMCCLLYTSQAGDTAQETAQTPTAAQTCGYTNLGMSVISSGNLNIRQEASTDSEVVGILTNHNACELLEDAGEWYKVTSGKVTGYVNKQYLVTGDEAESIAEQEIKTVEMCIRDRDITA